LNAKPRSGQIPEYNAGSGQKLRAAFYDRILHRVTVELDANICAGHEQNFLNVNSMTVKNSSYLKSSLLLNFSNLHLNKFSSCKSVAADGVFFEKNSFY
jgi:hypothetical protein